MIESLGRVLRLVLRPPDQPEPHEAHAPPAAPPEIEFSAFAEDCRIFGRVRLDADRLSDMLNAHDEFVLVEGDVESLAGGAVHRVTEFTISRDELLVVEASGPRGDAGRRTRSRPFPLHVRLGPYDVRGYVHVTPGADVLNAIRRRKPMIPLTNATLAYASGNGLEIHRAPTMLFNRENADWLKLADDEEMDLPAVPAVSGPLVKDFTGEILLP